MHERSASRDVPEEPVPSPLPSCAPSTRPGMSATTNRSSPASATPRLGVSGEGIVGDLRRGRGEPGQQRRLPALGAPRGRRRRPSAAPVQTPLVALLAALGRLGHAVLGPAKRTLPRPPRPPAPPRRPRRLPPGRRGAPLVGHDRPVGNREDQVLASRAVATGPGPGLARFRAQVGMVGEPREVVDVPGRADTTSPPRPPSPPSGPPLGVNGSLRIEAEPSPPRPPRTSTSTSSTNAMPNSLGGRRRREPEDGSWSSPSTVWMVHLGLRRRSPRDPGTLPRRGRAGVRRRRRPVPTSSSPSRDRSRQADPGRPCCSSTGRRGRRNGRPPSTSRSRPAGTGPGLRDPGPTRTARPVHTDHAVEAAGGEDEPRYPLHERLEEDDGAGVGRRRERADARALAADAGRTDAYFRPRDSWNSIVPARRANSVSSPPLPTPSPGWIRVPRWRTMIAPAETASPPNAFTPSRFEVESRRSGTSRRPSCAPWSVEATSYSVEAVASAAPRRPRPSWSPDARRASRPVISSIVRSWRWPAFRA